MSEPDFFTTDFSFLGDVDISQPTSRPKPTSRSTKAKVRQVGDITFTITRSDDSRAKTSASKLQYKFTEQHCNAIRASRHYDDEWRAHMSTSAKLRGMPDGMRKAKAIHTPLGDFASKALAAQAHGCDSTLLSYRLKRFPNEYYYI
jgi:hypothetical protein